MFHIKNYFLSWSLKLLIQFWFVIFLNFRKHLNYNEKRKSISTTMKLVSWHVTIISDCLHLGAINSIFMVSNHEMLTLFDGPYMRSLIYLVKYYKWICGIYIYNDSIESFSILGSKSYANIIHVFIIIIFVFMKLRAITMKR